MKLKHRSVVNEVIGKVRRLMNWSEMKEYTTPEIMRFVSCNTELKVFLGSRGVEESIFQYFGEKDYEIEL